MEEWSGQPEPQEQEEQEEEVTAGWVGTMVHLDMQRIP